MSLEHPSGVCFERENKSKITASGILFGIIREKFENFFTIPNYSNLPFLNFKTFLSKCSDACIFRFACIIYYDGNWYQRCLWKLSKRTFRWWNKFTGKFSSWCLKLALWLICLLTHRWWLISTNLKTSYSWQRWWIHKVLLKVKNGNIWGKIQIHVLVFEIYFSQIIFFVFWNLFLIKWVFKFLYLYKGPVILFACSSTRLYQLIFSF